MWFCRPLGLVYRWPPDIAYPIHPSNTSLWVSNIIFGHWTQVQVKLKLLGCSRLPTVLRNPQIPSNSRVPFSNPIRMGLGPRTARIDIHIIKHGLNSSHLAYYTFKWNFVDGYFRILKTIYFTDNNSYWKPHIVRINETNYVSRTWTWLSTLFYLIKQFWYTWVLNDLNMTPYMIPV